MSDVERFRRAVGQERFISEGIEDAAGSSTVLTGEFLVRGSGENLVDLTFPTAFTSKPLLSFGGEVQDVDLMVKGQYPTVSVVIAGWVTREAPPLSRLFTGCRLCVVTTGPQVQKMVIYWTLTGDTINLFGV